MKIRISQGVGSNPKLWAVLRDGKRTDMAGEFDLSDEPGRIDAYGIYGMSGIIWKDSGDNNTGGDVLPRRLYRSVNEWVSDIRTEYPAAEIIRADDEPQDWI